MQQNAGQAQAMPETEAVPAGKRPGARNERLNVRPKSAKEYMGEYRRAEPMKQRWYKVVFETIERKPIRRTVTVCSTDSVHASALVYQQFGRKKIKVKSAKKVKENT